MSWFFPECLIVHKLLINMQRSSGNINVCKYFVPPAHLFCTSVSSNVKTVNNVVTVPHLADLKTETRFLE